MRARREPGSDGFACATFHTSSNFHTVNTTVASNGNNLPTQRNAELAWVVTAGFGHRSDSRRRRRAHERACRGSDRRKRGGRYLA